ncbi:MAG: hypothetical protein AAF249_11490 [Pseudomonadota bacterium]
MNRAIDETGSERQASTNRRGFAIALAINFVWINLSEVWRYLMVIRPMLQETFPNDAAIAPFDLTTLAIWAVWDGILVFAATGFFWVYFKSVGASLRQAVFAALFFTIAVFGLLWVGAFNMGLVPARFIWVALPLAWLEQFVAAVIVWRVFRRK